MYKKIASNTFAQILSKILTAWISIFLIWILTKTLPVELYGSYNKVFSYLWIFAFLADLGLYAIAVREISKYDDKKEHIIGNILSLRLILWIGIWVLSFCIAIFLPWYSDIYTLSAIGIIGAFTVLSLLNSAILALMQSQMKMEFSLFSVVFGKLLNLWLVAYFLLVYFEKTPGTYMAFISVFIIATFAILVNTLLNYFYAKQICNVKFLFDREYILHIVKISLPYGIALFLSVVYFKVDILILSFLETPSQADVSIALYGLPMKIVEVLMVLWWFYLNSILPSLTQSFEQNNIQKVQKIFWISLKFLGSLGILICLLGLLFQREIISIIATQDYISPEKSLYSSVDVLSVVFFVLLFHFLALCCIYILIASGQQGRLLKINICITLVNIIWNIILIPYFSFYWAAIVTLASQVLLMLISWFFVWRHIWIPFRFLWELSKSLMLAFVLYFSFSQYFEIFSFTEISKVLLFGILITWLYIFFEYIFSLKIIRELQRKTS